MTADTDPSSVPSARPRYHHGDLREALLKAAEEELAEHGVEKFSLRGCAKRAGVSHAAPAHHFRDADDLLTELAARGFERLGQSVLTHHGASRGNAFERLTAIGVGYVAFAEVNPALFKLMFGSDRPENSGPIILEKATNTFVMLVDAMTELRGEDPFASADGTTNLAAAWSVVHGLAHLLIEKKLPFLDPLLAKDREATIRAVIERVNPRLDAE